MIYVDPVGDVHNAICSVKWMASEIGESKAAALRETYCSRPQHCIGQALNSL
jgi:hypothetical protein